MSGVFGRWPHAGITLTRALLAAAVSLAAAFAAPARLAAADDALWPTPDWTRAEPADVGLDARLLQQARDYALTGGGSGYIVRHGRLVMSWGDPKKTYDLKSTTKSIGVTALGLALDDRRAARGSDNWPLTWADDDRQYTAYGDGRGFEPLIDTKLSLGLACVEGPPEAFRGVNLRAPSFEQRGDGARGKKASGMLMVDGVLYAWVRNAGNAQLAWSRDRGATWQWSDWRLTESFGYPTFLNFGRNYDGARDAYVYVYSHDHDSAYRAADRMVLARVPKSQIAHREAYEFFAGLDDAGQPRWSADVGQRRAVFEHPGKCYRSGITYNAPLRRYLWCQVLPGPDPRFAGGLGIYDAPEPWGPWTTVFFTTQWDVGPGETASIPTKWISDDGRTIHLVFSGNDCFSVRQGVLRLCEP
jgi:hypothetical protein